MSEMEDRVEEAIRRFALTWVLAKNGIAPVLGIARAAIAAMREPTTEMREAASKLVDHCAVQNYGAPPQTDEVWDVMIGAALGE